MSVLQLPIFPLPLVLFPGVPQLLHIFEPRYRELLTDCMARDRRFGIAPVDSAEGDASPARGSVGCVAYVRARTSLPDGRSNILTVGEDRFVILDYVTSDRPYRTARVETFDDESEDVAALAETSARVGELFHRLTAVLNALGDSTAAPPEIDDDPKARSFQIAAALEIEPHDKQEILGLRSIGRRLRALEGLLRAALAGLGPRAEVHVRARRNGKGGPHPSIVQGMKEP